MIPEEELGWAISRWCQKEACIFTDERQESLWRFVAGREEAVRAEARERCAAELDHLAILAEQEEAPQSAEIYAWAAKHLRGMKP